MREVRYFLLLCLCFCLLRVDVSGSDGDQCKFPAIEYPLQYVTYKLRADQVIELDGNLDETAWTEVSWTDSFIDIEGTKKPKPKFETKVKMRWDDKYLYVGAFIQETQIWANLTKHDSIIFNDNDFEIFVDPDGSTHYYKEFEMNALNTTWDLILDKPYLDGGQPNWKTFDMPIKSGVHVEGTINNPSKADNKYWSVEVALPFDSYVTNCSVATSPPRHNDLWRINFSRVEWDVVVVDNHYEKRGVPEHNWVWSPQFAVNMHLPERWGFLQFSSSPQINSTAVLRDKTWNIRKVLISIYYAERYYSSIYGLYSSDLTALDLPPYVFDGSLGTLLPEVHLNSASEWTARVQSIDHQLPVGYIRQDRYFWFESQASPINFN